MCNINNSLESALAQVAEQEENLVFDSFDATAAWEIGAALMEKAKAAGVAYAINVSLCRRQLFHFSMEGAAPDNDNWIRRKENTVYHFHKSSMRVVLELRKNDWTLYPQFGLSPDDYAGSGGSFPIRLRNAGVVGAITVSGLPEEVDHQFVTEVIAQYLRGRQVISAESL